MKNHQDDFDRGYVAGQRAQLQATLRYCIRNLGGEPDLDPDLTIGRLTLHLEETRVALRRLSEQLGCGEWPETAYLADVIDKLILPKATLLARGQSP